MCRFIPPVVVLAPHESNANVVVYALSIAASRLSQLKQRKINKNLWNQGTRKQISGDLKVYLAIEMILNNT